MDVRTSAMYIFLSYTRKDSQFAKEIKDFLEASGLSVWQDITAIKGGTEWIDEIARGIRESYCIISIVSHNSLASRWVRLEFLEASRRKKHVIPVKIDDSEIPLEMLDLNVLSTQSGEFDKLNDAINAVRHALPTRTDLKLSVRRHLEIDYVDHILLQHSVWQEIYTPMAGIGQITDASTSSLMRTKPTDIQTKFQKRIRSSFSGREHKKSHQGKEYTNILDVINETNTVVLLGDPGSGKTTTLWHILAEYASISKADQSSPLPILIRLGETNKDSIIEQIIKNSLDGVSKYYDELLEEGRMVLLLDGLNEIPDDARRFVIPQIRQLVQLSQTKQILLIITCRELDYTGVTDLKVPDKIIISPLDPPRIYCFVKNYITEPEFAGEELFWLLAGETAREAWVSFSEKVSNSMEIFWLAEELPDGHRWDRGSSDPRYINTYWKEWKNQRDKPHSLLKLAKNPFMLYMITQVYIEQGGLPNNRGALFKLFVEFLLLDRESLNTDDANALQEHLADLAYAMQVEHEGTSIDKQTALSYMHDKVFLYHAQSASLLTDDIQIRFTHHLLQEYFAAKRLDREMKAQIPAKKFWPNDNWWEPNGWEETAILLAGLYSDDPSPVLHWLRDANPELMVRCINESGSIVSDNVVKELDVQTLWLSQMTDEENHPNPLERAAIGRALGILELDNRPGASLDAHGVPDIVWCKIPAGSFQMGGDPNVPLESWTGGTYEIDTFFLAKYPVTYNQFEAFINDNGYRQDAFWTKSGIEWREKSVHPRAYWNNPRWHISNHPVVGVTWYEAYAFTLWLSKRLGYSVRLATEEEWEKAARGSNGLFFPYGNKFKPHNNNTIETHIYRTTPVGIFTNGASPYGVCDMSGNMFEWCLSKWQLDYQYPSNIAPEGTARRIVHGGSWGHNSKYARPADRGYNSPSFYNDCTGFRIATSKIT